ncbi:MAG: hypothetical protein NT027_13650 [Proteobacteria bacterium]|nr:hypothetical protein [Pseudomonadota bacterium]
MFISISNRHANILNFRICKLLLKIATLCFLVSCGSGADSTYNKNETLLRLNEANESLFFTGIDVSSQPWQSALLHLDLGSQKVMPLLTGESSDPSVFSTDKSLFFFNRTADNKNYRKYDFTSKDTVFDLQRKLDNGAIGDPHDLIQLSETAVLLANYTEGSLVVLDHEKSTFQVLNGLDWDLPSGVKLKPESLLRKDIDGETRIFIAHQGLGFKDGMMIASGDQSVFVLKLRGNELIPVDLDLSKDKIQGIKIEGSLPVFLKPQSEKSPGEATVTTVSLCSRYIVLAGQLPGYDFPCKSMVEKIDVKTNRIVDKWDLSDRNLYMNGGITPGRDGSFYANVEYDSGTRKGVKEVIEFDMINRSVQKRYEFDQASGGFWGVFYHRQTDRLLVGDQGQSTVGKLSVLNREGQISTIDLSHVPYSGVFVSK